MVKSLLLVWLIGVVSFFALWAIIALAVRRISEKKEAQKQLGEARSEDPSKEEAPESNTPEG